LSKVVLKPAALILRTTGKAPSNVSAATNFRARKKGSFMAKRSGSAVGDISAHGGNGGWSVSGGWRRIYDRSCPHGSAAGLIPDTLTLVQIGIYPARACSRSAIKSSTCSRPTETRSRLSGVGESAPSTEARCSIKLSVPPRLVALANRRHR